MMTFDVFVCGDNVSISASAKARRKECMQKIIDNCCEHSGSMCLNVNVSTLDTNCPRLYANYSNGSRITEHWVVKANSRESAEKIVLETFL